MASKQRSKAAGPSGGEEIKVNVRLQAIILADSFNKKFRPITLDNPRALLPVVNVPVLDYTFEFLIAGGVKEIFVVCCAHNKKIATHIQQSKWQGSGVEISTIVLPDCKTAGDAIRDVDQKGLIKGDFVLVSGDLVSNMRLDVALEEHRRRRDRDKQCLMTCVFKRCAPNHRTRSLEDDTVIAIDPVTNQLLAYEYERSRHTKMHASILSDHATVSIRHDLLDCNIDICSPDVPMLLTDNPDYQDLRQDFLRGMLNSEERDVLGNKIYGHIITNEYAARVQCLGTYAAVSKDIIRRWTFPLVPDTNFMDSTSYKWARGNRYYEEGVVRSRSCEVGDDTVVGRHTQILDRAKIVRCVIGRNCVIGKDVVMEDSFIWDNVRIEDGARVSRSIISSGAVVGRNAVVAQGCVISYNVEIGEGFHVPECTKLTLRKRGGDDSDDGDDDWDEEEDEDAGICGVSPADPHTAWDRAAVGPGGKGFKWDEPAQKFGLNSLVLDGRPVSDDGDSETTVGDTGSASGSAVIDEGDRFVREVRDTVLRADQEGHKTDNIVLEINSLKFAYDKTFQDCTNAILPAILAFIDTKSVVKSAKTVLAKWTPLMLKFRHSFDDQYEILCTLQDYCIENGEFSKVFRVLLQLLYETDVLEEEAILKWSEESRADAEGMELKLLDQAQPFLDWLREEQEDSGEEGSEESASEETPTKGAAKGGAKVPAKAQSPASSPVAKAPAAAAAKASPKASPKGAAKGAGKDAPKDSPKASPKGAAKGTPAKASPAKASPKASPKGTAKGGKGTPQKGAEDDGEGSGGESSSPEEETPNTSRVRFSDAEKAGSDAGSDE